MKTVSHVSYPLVQTELGKAMLASRIYDDAEAVSEAIIEMRQRVRNGEDPEEVLHEEGFEPDFVFDLI